MRISLYTAAMPLFALALGGCGTMNTTSSELVSNASLRQTHCIPAEKKIVEQRVEQVLNACYEGKGGSLLPAGGVLIPLPGFIVDKEAVSGATRFSVRCGSYYSMTVDVATQPQACGTTLNIYAVTGLWSEKVDHVVSVARDEPIANCPSLR